MKRCLLALICLSCLVSLVYAQEKTQIERKDTLSSLRSEVGLIPESLDANVDSLLRTWHVQYFSKRGDFCHDDDENVYFPDSVYIDHLSRLPNAIALPYNSVVRDCINLYVERKRNLVRYMLGMASFYFPVIEQVLDEHGLPIELKYLVVVESASNPVALSCMGTCGLWQFTLPTGKSYGLEINSLVNERRNPLKATEAAYKYFKDMYAVHGDWNLVLASYNCGPDNVNKAIRRSGGKTDFWDIFPYLPKETRSYVPLFIAANHVMNYYYEHSICPIQTSLPLAADMVMVNNALHLQQVSDLLQVDIGILRALNPQYKRDIVPDNTRPSVLKLPAAKTCAFIDKEDTVYTHRIEKLLANCISTSSSNDSLPSGAAREKITHMVLNDENLYTITNRYGMTAKDIRKWNEPGSNRVAKGERLRLYTDNGGVAFASTSVATKQIASANKDFVSYGVKSGDSLRSVSKKYPGVTASSLQKVNRLSSSDICPGQASRIPVG